MEAGCSTTDRISSRGFKIRTARQSFSTPRVNLDAARPKSAFARPRVESTSANFRIRKSAGSEEPVKSEVWLLEAKKRELEIVRQKKNEIIAGQGRKFNSLNTDARALINTDMTDDTRPKS